MILIIAKKIIIISFLTSFFWGCATTKSDVITISDVEADPFRYVLGAVTSAKVDEETLMRVYTLNSTRTKLLAYCQIKQALNEPVIYDRQKKELHFLRIDHAQTGNPTVCKVRSIQ